MMPQTVLRRHYMLTMRLDLSRVDAAHLQFLVQRLQSHGIVVNPLCKEQAYHTEAIRQAYRCHNECRKQQPPVELRQEPLAFEKWTDAFVDGEAAAPDLYFLARHQEEYVGVCLFVPKPDEADTVESGFTGVLPAWTGQGIAKSLKAHGLLGVRQRGFRYVETHTLVVNRGMYAINRSLGFEITQRRLHTYPIPVALPSSQGLEEAATLLKRA